MRFLRKDVTGLNKQTLPFLNNTRNLKVLFISFAALNPPVSPEITESIITKKIFLLKSSSNGKLFLFSLTTGKLGSIFIAVATF